MKKRSIQIFVTSDLVTDQRVQRVASTLYDEGYDVVVYGRKTHAKIVLPATGYTIKKIGTLAKKGIPFYVVYNLKILLIALTHKCSLIYANDLDTLLGCSIASAIRRKPLIYDCHEFFTEIPELIEHRTKKNIWRMAEKMCIKRTDKVITVSNGIANLLDKSYGTKSIVIRNLPQMLKNDTAKDPSPTIIYQGWLNVGRGIELIISTMKYLPNFKLVIAGKGDIENKLRQQVADQNLGDQIVFTGRLTPDKLKEQTARAWLGISLEEDLGLNYRYTLPNKLFDYIAAQTPALVSDLPEMGQIIEEFGVGLVAKNRNPKAIAEQIDSYFQNRSQQKAMAANLLHTAKILNWDNEKHKLISTIEQAIG